MSGSCWLAVLWHQPAAHTPDTLRGALCSRASVLAGLLGLYPEPSFLWCLSPCRPLPLTLHSSSLQTAHASSLPTPCCLILSLGYVPSARPGDPPRTGPSLLPTSHPEAWVWTQWDAPRRQSDSWVLTQTPQNSALLDCHGGCEFLRTVEES